MDTPELAGTSQQEDIEFVCDHLEQAVRGHMGRRQPLGSIVAWLAECVSHERAREILRDASERLLAEAYDA